MTKNLNLDNFFEQYRTECEKANNGDPVFVPKPDPNNGFNDVDILFINERPGPDGPQKTRRVSFDNPDQTAKNFKELFKKTFGLSYRKRIFITNACIWCPDVKGYKNKTPTAKELKDGKGILQSQINFFKPKLIVTVGVKALYSVNLLLRFSRIKNIRLRGYVDKHKPIENKGNTPVYPVFHTSRLGQSNRSKKEQKIDWKFMRKSLEKIKKLRTHAK